MSLTPEEIEQGVQIDPVTGQKFKDLGTVNLYMRPGMVQGLLAAENAEIDALVLSGLSPEQKAKYTGSPAGRREVLLGLLRAGLTENEKQQGVQIDETTGAKVINMSCSMKQGGGFRVG